MSSTDPSESLLSFYGAMQQKGITPEISFTHSNVVKQLNAANLSRIFGNEATGLGLSIARSLTERMGGSIQAEYEKGKLKITLSFP